MAVTGIIAIAVGLIGAGVSAYAAYEAAQGQAKAMSYQKKVARNQATAAQNAAAIAADQQADEDRRIMAAQRARIGAAGVDADVGSPLLVQMESAGDAELNRLRQLYAGKIQAQGFESEAILQGYQAKQVRRAGYLQAGSTLLTGAGQSVSAYQSMTYGRSAAN